MRHHREFEGETGAVLVTVLFSIVALLAMAALVLDLAAVRVNRAASQTVADSAATAAALEAEGFNGRAACETALDYLELNLPHAGPFSGADCLSFTNNCEAGITPSSSTIATAGSWIATLTYPVPNGSPLLTSSAIGQPTQPLHPDDGDPCERFGVSIQGTHNYLFGRVLGATSGTTEIHAVARGFVPDGHQFALNLLILERFDCSALSVNTSGGGGGIVVDAVLNDDGVLDQGFIAVDSDASAGCGGPGVINTNGGGAVIRADGPDGCLGQVGSHLGAGGNTVGEGCGQIQLLAPGVPGCNWPACTNSGVIAPDPVPRRERITRAPVDHRYNCKSTYNFGVGWEIDPCTEIPAPPPYIDLMVGALSGPGVPAGYTPWPYACNPGLLVVPAGDYYIDCANFRPDDVTFEGGNVVFEGNVRLTGSASLTFNSDPTVTESTIYFRSGGAITMTGGALTINQATVYISDHNQSELAITGGDIVWSAPETGNFQDLALWYESEQEAKFSGGGAVDLDGVFFAPWADIGYAGNGGQSQVSAQFISRGLKVSGNGTLVVRPSWERAVLFPFDPQTDLIR